MWLVIGWAMVATVILLSLVPLEADLSEGKDKWSHFVAYGALMFWFCLLYVRQHRWAAAFIAMGVVIEILQSYTGHRSFEYADMAADAVGVLLGACAPARAPLPAPLRTPLRTPLRAP